MAAEGRTPPNSAASDGIAPAGNGLGQERMVEIQRARILSGMVEVSAERGVSNVTVAHIVARAGVSRRTFYTLFDDREDCFLAAFDDAVMRAGRYVLDVYDPDAPWVERVRAGLLGLLSFLDLERRTGQLLLVGSLEAGTDALARRRHVLAQLIDVIDEAREQIKTTVQPPPLMAEGIVGGALSVLHARLIDIEASEQSFLALAGPLMSMIVLPYLGPAAAQREFKRPVPAPVHASVSSPADALRDVTVRLTYRTIRVLMAVAAYPHSSNREIAITADIHDQGQISKLLTRLANIGLVQNTGTGQARGAPNAWTLTRQGHEVQQALVPDSALL